jgi:hypothetical protein
MVWNFIFYVEMSGLAEIEVRRGLDKSFAQMRSLGFARDCGARLRRRANAASLCQGMASAMPKATGIR